MRKPCRKVGQPPIISRNFARGDKATWDVGRRSVTIRNFPPPWARWMGKGPGGWKLCAFESFSRITYEIDWKREVSRYLWYTVAWTTTLKKPPLVLFQKKLEFFRSEFTFFNHFSSFCCSLNAIQNILCRWLCREGKWDFEVKGDLEIKRLEVYREYLFREAEISLKSLFKIIWKKSKFRNLINTLKLFFVSNIIIFWNFYIWNCLKFNCNRIISQCLSLNSF